MFSNLPFDDKISIGTISVFQIQIDLSWNPASGPPASPRDTCVIRDQEFDCNFDEGFCARRPAYPYGPKVCQWIAPQTPCAPRG